MFSAQENGVTNLFLMITLNTLRLLLTLKVILLIFKKNVSAAEALYD